MLRPPPIPRLFPYTTLFRSAPALAFGNTVVFKPSELTPMMGWKLTEIIAGAGGPPGLVNLVNGTGPVAGQDRKSTRLNSSHSQISYAVFCLKKKKNICGT